MSAKERQGRFVWYDLMSQDPEGAVAFYTHVVGWGTQDFPGGEEPYTMWTVAGVLLAFSSTVAVIGMTEPYPGEGYDRYTARQALQRLMHNASNDPTSTRTAPVARAPE